MERFQLDDSKYLPDDVKSILLASSAIPLIFPSEELFGEKYYDGGFPIFGDNVPVRPVYDLGIENILVVHLNRETIIDKKQFPNSNIIEIVPSKDLGNAMNGTLDFSPYGAKKRINDGYEDAKKVLQPMLEMLFLFFKNQISLKQLKEHLPQFDKDKSELLAREAEIKKKMANDGFDSIVDK